MANLRKINIEFEPPPDIKKKQVPELQKPLTPAGKAWRFFKLYKVSIIIPPIVLFAIVADYRRTQRFRKERGIPDDVSLRPSLNVETVKRNMW